MSRLTPALRALLCVAVVLVAALGLKVLRVRAANEAIDTSECILIRTYDDGRRLFLCPPETGPTPTATQVAATATPPSVATPTVVAQPGEPYPDAPLCDSHDPRVWHALWDAARGCHYDHHHGDDPHSVDDIFGTAYYDWAGGSISYPWQTVNAQTGCLENDCKHTGYVWLVRRGQPCSSAYTDGCVTDFRALVHAMSSAHDTSVRYHSAWVEMRVCVEDSPDVCGIFRSGGWQDSGDLIIDNVRVLDYPNNYNRHKLHYLETGNSHFGAWYASSPGGEEQRGGFWQVAVEIGDMWGPLDPADPSRLQFFCPDPHMNCGWNGSSYKPEIIGLVFPPRFLATIDPDGDGFATYDGYADRYGTPVTGCTSPSLDCVPLVFENVPLGHMYQGVFDYLDYDVFFGRETSGWIQYQH
jgi:hypothetical protein